MSVCLLRSWLFDAALVGQCLQGYGIIPHLGDPSAGMEPLLVRIDSLLPQPNG